MASGKRRTRRYRDVPMTKSASVGRTTERNINAKLGDLLRDKHPRWYDRIDTESTGIFKGKPQLCPDLLIRHPGGSPVIVETKFRGSSTKVGSQVESVEQDAIDRLSLTINDGGETVEQSISVRYPDELRNLNQYMLDVQLQGTELEYCVFSGTPDDYKRWPSSGWMLGGIDDLANCIEHVSLSEDRVARGMTILEDGVSDAAYILREADHTAPDMLKKVASHLYQSPGEQTTRMAMAILANAMTFHATIAGSHGIPQIDELRMKGGRISKTNLLQLWWHILENINYWPIFQIASDILLPLRNGTAHKILDRLAQVASQLVDLGAASQQDLCGRMFQRLITDRKFLATFYTLPSSSALLAELAVERMKVKWSDVAAVESLKVSDFACGTGALLNATYGAMMSRFRRSGGDDVAIHPRMMESVLVGADIMPVAWHLTASALSSSHPSVPFNDTSIILLPYGKQLVKSSQVFALGALDLIEGETTRSLFELGQKRLKGGQRGKSGNVDLPHHSFDLVILNPPFTRPTNHEAADVPIPSFAGFDTSDDEQKAMSNRLNKVRKPVIGDMAGHGNAGLASNFIDVADMKVKRGGVVAIVLPLSFLQGDAWSNARSLFEKYYRDIIVVSIASAGSTDRSFSADTGMAEVLIVATRGDPKKKRGSTLFINLEHRPRTILEAVATASAVSSISVSQDSGKLWIGSKERAGCFIRGNLSQAGGAGVRDEDIAMTALHLTQGRLCLAQRQKVTAIPVTNLGSLGDRGLLHRDINGKNVTGSGQLRGPFDIVDIKPKDVPAYPALWNHNRARERHIIVEPDSQGIPRDNCRDRAVRIWDKTKSRLHFNLDFQVNSQSLSACITREPAIGGTAWPNFRCDEPQWENALVLWSNTLLGLISFWWIGTRQQKGRTRLTISRLPELTVLDPRELSPKQFDLADRMFEEFSDRDFLPANEAWRDKTRQELDRAMLTDLLQLSEDILEPLALLRRQWCAEPSVHGGKGTHPSG